MYISEIVLKTDDVGTNNENYENHDFSIFTKQKPSRMPTVFGNLKWNLIVLSVALEFCECLCVYVCTHQAKRAE